MSLFKISIISSLFLHCVVFFLLKNLEINNEKNENLDLQIVSQIITKNVQEPIATCATTRANCAHSTA